MEIFRLGKSDNSSFFLWSYQRVYDEEKTNLAQGDNTIETLKCIYPTIKNIETYPLCYENGVYKDLLPKHKRLFAYERRGEDELLLVISNFSKGEAKCNLMKKYSEFDCEVLLNNYNEVDFNLLKPYQSVLYLLSK